MAVNLLILPMAPGEDIQPQRRVGSCSGVRSFQSPSFRGYQKSYAKPVVINK